MPSIHSAANCLCVMPFVARSRATGLAALAVGTTASFTTGTHHPPLFSSSGWIAREIMPMSTSPPSTSAAPLPAPPPPTSTRTPGLIFWNSLAHRTIKGYIAHAPDTRTVPVSPAAAAGVVRPVPPTTRDASTAHPMTAISHTRRDTMPGLLRPCAPTRGLWAVTLLQECTPADYSGNSRVRQPHVTKTLLPGEEERPVTGGTATGSASSGTGLAGAADCLEEEP